MRTLLSGLSVLALASGLGACATVTRGSTEKFTITTTPPDAHARTSSGFTCESTPCTIRMPRKDAFTITVSKPGYKTVSMDIKPHLAGSGAAGFVGNALIGGVIGGAVDVSTGATMDLTPNPLNVTLEPVEIIAAPSLSPAAAPVAPSPAPAPPPSASAAAAKP